MNDEWMEMAEDATVTLELDDGEVLECDVICIFEASNGQAYIALMPSDDDEAEEGEVYIYRFSSEGDEVELGNIEDDDEFEIASDGFDEWLDNQEFDELVFEDEEAGE